MLRKKRNYLILSLLALTPSLNFLTTAQSDQAAPPLNPTSKQIPILDIAKINESTGEEAKDLTLDQKIEFHEGKKIHRPTKISTKLKPVIEDYKIDGFKGSSLFLVSDKLTLKNQSLPGWDAKAATTPKYSISFTNRYTPQVVLSYSVFSKAIFPLKEDPESFISYLSGLKSIHRDKISFDSTPETFREKGYNSHLLNKPTYCIEYTLKAKKKEDNRRHFNYLISSDNYWIEISLSAPEEQFGHYIDTFKTSLRTTVITEEKP